MNKDRLVWSLGVVVLLLVCAGKICAHELGTSYIRLTAEADTCKVIVSLDSFDMLKIGLDQDGDDALSDAEMTAGLDQLLPLSSRTYPCGSINSRSRWCATRGSSSQTTTAIRLRNSIGGLRLRSTPKLWMRGLTGQHAWETITKPSPRYYCRASQWS